MGLATREMSFRSCLTAVLISPIIIFRSQGEKKHIMVFRVLKVSSDEEIDAHALEVEHAKLKVGICCLRRNEEPSVLGGSTGPG